MSDREELVNRLITAGHMWKWKSPYMTDGVESDYYKIADFILADRQRLRDEIAKDSGFWGRTCARQSQKLATMEAEHLKVLEAVKYELCSHCAYCERAEAIINAKINTSQ